MKKPFICLLTTGLVFSMIVNTGITYAAESNATITFTPPTDVTAPVDPTNPGEPFPGDVDEEGTVPDSEEAQGPLSLDFVTHIAFGNKNISTSEQTYEALTSSPFVQVTDRRGTGAGWNITASASNFTMDSENTLPGAEINFANGTTVSTANTPNPGINNNIQLVTGSSAVTVASASIKEDGAPLNTAEGLGTWVMRWLSDNETNENVTLYVPEASASEGTHTATINWTLTSGPSDDDSNFDEVTEETEG